MRVCDSLLIKAGRSGSLTPSVKISIGDMVFYNDDRGVETCRNTDAGKLWSTRSGDRIEEVRTFEQPYGGSANQKSKITFHNADNFLTNINFKGERVSVSWGAQTTKGALYDTQPPFYVKSQTSVEQPSMQNVTLVLLGLTDWLGEDVAQCDYISNGTDTLYDLAVKVLGASIAPFTGCKAFNIIKDTDYDGVFDVVIPGPSFHITKDKDTRASVMARIFDLTYVKMRAGCEDLISSKDSVHFFVPSPMVTQSVSLEETDHKYFISQVYSSIFRPNYITVKNPNNEGLTYTGLAKDLVSWKAIPTAQTVYISGLSGNAQATLVANTMLQNTRSYYNGFSAKVPMLFGSELFDKIQLVSGRSDKTYSGNLGTIERTYRPHKGEPEYYCNVQSGKWFDPRAVWDVMGIGSGYVDTSEDNLYQTVFVPVLSYTAKLGDWDSDADSLGLCVAEDTDGSWIKYKVKIPSGSYYYRSITQKADYMGIMKVYLDDVLAITLDCYDPSYQNYIIDELVTISDSTSSYHEVKILIDGKNASSSAYITAIYDIVFKVA